MQIFNNIDQNTFSFNGRRYVKNFIALKVGNTHVGVYNAYDTKLQLLDSTHFSEIQVEGNVATSQANAMASLAPLLFVKGGAGTSTISNQNNQMSYFNGGNLEGNGYITADEVATWINAQPFSFVVADTATPVLFEFQRTENEITNKFIFIFSRGKGQWGAAGGSNANNPNGGTVYNSFFKLLSVIPLTPDDIANNDNNIIFDLGNVPNGDYVATAQMNEYELNDPNKTYYFSFNTYSQQAGMNILYFVQFVGVAGTYGGGNADNLDFTSDDFISSTNNNTPTNFVPYSGATSNVNLGQNNLTVGGRIDINTSTVQDDDGNLLLSTPELLTLAASATRVNLSNGGVSIKTGVVGNAILKTDNLTGDRTYQFPNSGGTFVTRVNGLTADTTGNITIPVTPTPTIAQVLAAGNIATDNQSPITLNNTVGIVFGNQNTGGRLARDFGLLSMSNTGDISISVTTGNSINLTGILNVSRSGFTESFFGRSNNNNTPFIAKSFITKEYFDTAISGATIGYVPYTGATIDLQLGEQSISAQRAAISHSVRVGDHDIRTLGSTLEIKATSSLSMIAGNSSILLDDSNIKIKAGSGSGVTSFRTDLVTGESKIAIPNASGIMPLSVNSYTADTSGNISVPLFQNFQELLQSGSTADIATTFELNTTKQILLNAEDGFSFQSGDARIIASPTSEMVIRNNNGEGIDLQTNGTARYNGSEIATIEVLAAVSGGSQNLQSVLENGSTASVATPISISQSTGSTGSTFSMNDGVVSIGGSDRFNIGFVNGFSINGGNSGQISTDPIQGLSINGNAGSVNINGSGGGVNINGNNLGTKITGDNGGVIINGGQLGIELHGQSTGQGIKLFGEAGNIDVIIDTIGAPREFTYNGVRVATINDIPTGTTVPTFAQVYNAFSGNTNDVFTGKSTKIYGGVFPATPTFSVGNSDDRNAQIDSKRFTLNHVSASAVVQSWFGVGTDNNNVELRMNRGGNVFNLRTNPFASSGTLLIPGTVTSGSTAAVSVNGIFADGQGNVTLPIPSASTTPTLWGQITGSLSAQTDLNAILSNKIGLNANSPTTVKDIWVGNNNQYATATTANTTMYFVKDESQEVKGSISLSANGTTAIYIPHSLGVIPAYVNVIAKSPSATGVTYVSATTTNIIVNHSAVPTGMLQYWINYSK